MIFFTTQWLKAARANLTPNAVEYEKRKNKNEFNGRVRTRMLELRPKHFFGTVLPVCLHPVHFPIHHAGIFVHAQHLLPGVAAFDVSTEILPPLQCFGSLRWLRAGVLAPLSPLAFFLAVFCCSFGRPEPRLNVSVVEPSFQFCPMDSSIYFKVNLQVRRPWLWRYNAFPTNDNVCQLAHCMGHLSTRRVPIPEMLEVERCRVADPYAPMLERILVKLFRSSLRLSATTALWRWPR